jgi:hypothetical protein
VTPIAAILVARTQLFFSGTTRIRCDYFRWIGIGFFLCFRWVPISGRSTTGVIKTEDMYMTIFCDITAPRIS